MRSRLAVFAATIACGLAGTAVTASAASAADISDSYCNYSLTGGGSLAPDGDVQAYWAYLQGLGYYVYGAVEHTANRDGDQGTGQLIHELWRFGTNYGNVYEWFTCWRDGGSPYGTYHDNDGYFYPF